MQNAKLIMVSWDYQDQWMYKSQKEQNRVIVQVKYIIHFLKEWKPLALQHKDWIMIW